MSEIFEFVQNQEGREHSIQQEGADSEAIIIQENQKAGRNNRLDDKQKWEKIMEFMRKNPKVLVDALPDPEPVNQTLYHPMYDEILDQENLHRNMNVSSSHNSQHYDNYSKNVVTVNTQNRDSLDVCDNSNIKIIPSQGNRSSWKGSLENRKGSSRKNKLRLMKLKPQI